MTSQKTHRVKPHARAEERQDEDGWMASTDGRTRKRRRRRDPAGPTWIRALLSFLFLPKDNPPVENTEPNDER